MCISIPLRPGMNHLAFRLRATDRYGSKAAVVNPQSARFGAMMNHQLNRDEIVKRAFIGICEAREPLMRQAFEAIRQLHEGEVAGLPAHEVRRLRLLADSLYQAVIDYQLVKTGCFPSAIQ